MLKKIFGSKDKPARTSVGGVAPVEEEGALDGQAPSSQTNEPAPPIQSDSTTPSSTSPKLAGVTPTDQAMELLSTVDPDDVLELMIPRLIQERHRRLAQLDQELNQLDKQLAELQHRRDDALMINSSNQTNKDFTQLNPTSNSQSKVEAEVEPSATGKGPQRENSEAKL